MGVWLVIGLGLALLAAVATLALGDVSPSGWISAAAATGAFGGRARDGIRLPRQPRSARTRRRVLLGRPERRVPVSVTFVYAVVAVYSVGSLKPGIGHIRLRRVYRPLLNVFDFALLATPMVANLGVLWVAVEPTTVVSALLVTSEGSDEALEAGWKYIVIGSAGLAGDHRG